MSIAGWGRCSVITAHQAGPVSVAAMAEPCAKRENMFCYCLFCESGKSRFAAGALVKIRSCRTIIPRQTLHTWRRGEMVNMERDLFPGYLFLYSDVRWSRDELRSVDGVIQCLRTTDQVNELQGEDEQFALSLLNTDGVIGKTRVYQEGQLIRLCSGAFTGLKARILKVDRRSHCIKIEIPFASRLIQTWVEYEMTELAEEKDAAPAESDPQAGNPVP